MAAREASAIPPYVVVVNAGSKYSPKKLNIDGGDDPFGRYQVPQLLCQVVGKGKMIKTMLLNIDVVAAALHTEPAYICAWLGYEIGAAAKYEAKKPDRERGSVSGNYTSEVLSGHMKRFIREVILCGKCNLPELILSLKGKRDPAVSLSCDSCGASYKLLKISPKFKKFITNNPPAPVAAKDKSAERKKKEIAAAQREGAASPAPIASTNDAEPVDPDAPAPTFVVDAATGELVNLDELADAAAAQATDGATSVDVAWSVDLSEEAALARKNELVTQAVKQLIGSSVDEHAAWIAPDCTDLKEIVETGVARSRDPLEVIQMIFARVFNSHRTPEAFANVLTKNIPTLEPFFQQEQEFQNAMLDCLGPFIASSPDLLPRVAGILQILANTGLVEDEAFDSWWAEKQKAYGDDFFTHTSDFMEWLRGGDDDDDDAEEEE